MSNFPETGQTFGRYRIVGRLGRGGMGVVFRAEQADLGREVALKVLPPEHAEVDEFRERFKREAAVLASLDSPHITQIIDYGEQDGCLYLATQLVKGGDLGQSIVANGPMPLSEALDVVAQLAGGLADAHAAGVIHRDVKPSNVLLRRSDQLTHAYLCDFGIAAAGNEGLTRAGVVVGSYGYLAPERLSDGPASPQSDIYSLGCLLVTSVTGRLPYSGTDLEVAEAHLSSPIPQWEETTPVLALLNNVLRRSMAKQPQERYASAQEMRSDLLAAKQQVRAPRAAAPVPAQSTIRRSAVLPPGAGAVATGIDPTPPERPARRRWVVAAVAAALVAVLGGVVWALAAAGDDPRESDNSSSSREPDESGAPTPAEPSSTTAPQDLCWNGRAVRANGTCTEPVGERGMRWVFPTIDELGSPACGRASAGQTPGKLLAWKCRMAVDAGTVTITFSEWNRWRSAADDYAIEDYPDFTPRRRGAFLVYGPKPIDAGFRSSIMYADDHAFSATVISDSEDAVRQGIGRLQPRTPREFRR